MRALRNALLPLVLVMSSGCCATVDLIRSEYTAADRATYDAIAPAYLKYVKEDASIDDDEKKTRERTVTTWDMRLKNAEAPVVVAPEGE